MAKSEISPKVKALTTIKSMISTIKLHSLAIAFDSISNLIYMAPIGGESESFGVIHDPELSLAAKEFHNYILNTPEVVGFNKALKKTMTKVKENDDKSLLFSTDGYTETLLMPYLADYKDVTKMYSKLFKDTEVTKGCLNAIYGNSYEWIGVKEDDLDRLRNNELVVLYSGTSDSLFVSKSIFGGLKKTKSLSHTVIETDEDSELILFRQEEDGYCIYKLIRYLTNL